MKPVKRILGAFTALSLLMSGTFSLTAAADDDEIGYKISYSSKYTYLELTPSDEDNTIRYTADGSVPTIDSKAYKNRLRASEAVTIRAAEFDEDGEKVDTIKINLKRKCMKPEINTAKTDDGFEVYLSSDIEGAVIYYTTDGSKPTKKSAVYDESFTVEKGTVVRAYVAKDGWKSSKYLKYTVKKATDDAAVVSAEVNYGDSGYDDLSLEILELVNAYRKEYGLSELKMDKQLYEAANIRARELEVLYSHDRPDGSTCFSVFDEVGFDRSYGGENIAYTEGSFSSAETVMQLWMDSPSHKKNILNTKGSLIGIGCYKIGDTIYWVQIFGERR